ncbi:chemotaxis protein CheA [Xanthomonas campestris pv. campestris]|uniref:chemotaxis protein CheA n=1 Tax=Xanthomonas campestris TaxID=339 RepID=UPI002379545A|nr:chemotaxis protein CheA [Xanthomonas campestris]WDK56459.1 chemotaxis protein CheA [Xanthomonas campestris pv. campestris]WDK64629.1 chemotaxis protein CheA [Xanthomonas campestris pv. campestris]WDK68673.1 chemotaxis protein CheA [Xanthomonas campestris pv. campestris]WDK72546.1 chemotaxis protein CheA [Xanthomonas campestris pv. campestris]WDK76750.1 chemotaxis protein CheA [Xanthomonas campestris pv. campestris]
MSMDLQRFHATFFEESREGLDAMEAGLLSLEEGNRDPEIINSVFRAAHSIKGGAATFGFEAVAGLTHVLETLLDELRSNKRQLEPNGVDAMLGSVDVLRALLREAEHGTPADPAAVKAVHTRLNAVLAGEAPAAVVVAKPKEEEPEAWHIGFTPAPSLFMSGNDPLRIIRELEHLGPLQIAARLERMPGFENIDPLEAYLAWDLGLIGKIPRSKIEDTFAWVVDDCELDIRTMAVPGPPPSLAVEAAGTAAVAVATTAAAEPAAAAAATPAKAAAAEAESSIRVSVDKVDALINLVGELVITQAMLKQVSTGLDPAHAEQLFAGLDLLERNTRDLQEAVIGVRMLPVDAVFRRFPRLVRDLSSRLGKQVRLRTIGESTELDKGLIEKIADPLVHLVRNSIDHGLEMPDARRASGKDETGTITLAASHQGGHIVIEVSDDGRGLNRAKILEKAAERGIAVPDNPTDSQVWDLIFAPGFSTADAVTDLSGRGVGMDVVRRNIQGLGGEVQLESNAGSGTRVLIRLPLTLAILDGMTVSVAGETLILPLSYVLEALQPAPEDVRSMAGDGRVLRVRGEYLPILSLTNYYGFGGQQSSKESLVVVVEGDGQKIALEVDELLGQQQVVVKNIENNYRRIPGVSGATILGDGRVSLIVDIGGLVRSLKVPQAA